MISPSKIILVTGAFFSLFQFCCQEWPKQEQSSFTPDAQRFINMILDENPGATCDVDIIDSSTGGGFSDPGGYMLGLIVGDKVVLTNTIDSLRQNGIYRFWKSGYGTGSSMVDLEFRGIKVKCDTLDSIEIISDSVIALERLDLRWCNLIYLPPEIGKIRTKKLDISWNKGIILPVEITQMDSLPQPYNTFDVDFDQTWTAETFETLPEWAKDWLGKHNL
jgi:hypothetical protein